MDTVCGKDPELSLLVKKLEENHKDGMKDQNNSYRKLVL